MADLTAVDNTNAILQKDGKAATSVKRAHQAVVDYLHATSSTPPTQPPSSGYPFVPAPPQVTAQPVNSAQWFRDVTHPVEIKNLHVSGAPDYGVALMGYFPSPPPSPSPFNIHDVIGENVGHWPTTMNGTGEAGLWIGSWANVTRFTADGTWMGLWTGANCSKCTFTDFTATSQGVGVYNEHDTVDCTFKNFNIKSGNNGVNIEWWYGGHGSSGLTYDTGSIYCPSGCYGVFADAGTFGCVFRNIDFYGPGNAICLPNKRAGAGTQNVVENCRFHNTGSQVTYHDNGIG